MTYLLVSIFLSAIVAANLAVAHFGQPALIVTAFVLIPFDLVTRDILHDKWKGKMLWWKMMGLIVGGSVLTASLSLDALQIAIASTVAFSTATACNALVYHLLRKRVWVVRMNISNLLASITDSVVFPLIAFDTVSIWLCAGQASSKFTGGLFWSALAVGLISYIVRKKQK